MAKAWIAVAVAAMTLGMPRPLPALDTPNERVSLAGLTGVHLVVEEVGPEGEREGVTAAGLQADVELRLRQAGLRVLTAAEAVASAGRPTLTVRIRVARSRDAASLYVYSVDLALRQQVRLSRDRQIESFAVTWSENRDVGAVPAARLGAVREALRAKVDQFIQAWKAVNQDQ